MKNAKRITDWFYKAVVIYARENKGLDPDVLKLALKDYAFKHLVEILESDPSKPNCSVLKNAHLRVIAALRPKGNKSDEWNKFDASLKHLDEALDKCADEIITASKDYRTRPSSAFSEFMNALHLMVVVASGLFVGIGLGLVASNGAKRIMDPNIIKLALIATLILGTANVVVLGFFSEKEQDFQDAIATVSSTLQGLDTTLKKLNTDLNTAKDKDSSQQK